AIERESVRRRSEQQGPTLLLHLKGGELVAVDFRKRRISGDAQLPGGALDVSGRVVSVARWSVGADVLLECVALVLADDPVNVTVTRFGIREFRKASNSELGSLLADKAHVSGVGVFERELPSVRLPRSDRRDEDPDVGCVLNSGCVEDEPSRRRWNPERSH